MTQGRFNGEKRRKIAQFPRPRLGWHRYYTDLVSLRINKVDAAIGLEYLDTGAVSIVKGE